MCIIQKDNGRDTPYNGVLQIISKKHESQITKMTIFKPTPDSEVILT